MSAVGGAPYRPGMAVDTMDKTFELTDQHRLILEIEAQRWKYLGAKETLIREQLGISPIRYNQVLVHLLDQPAALAYDAQLVNRLRRLRGGRRRVR